MTSPVSLPVEAPRPFLRRLNNVRRVAGFRGIWSWGKGALTGKSFLIKLRKPGVKHPIFLRIPSSDPRTFDQIFIRSEYDFAVRRQPKVIVDAGANIGLASIYFANKYPEARIISVEPELGNFRVLEKNAASYPNIVPVRAAVWKENTKINVVDPGLGEWAFMTHEKGAGAPGQVMQEVDAMTIDRIVENHKLDHIDILKIDVEGAECEIFENPSAWIDRVDSMIVELHERMKPGCNRSFYRSTEHFGDEWWRGENAYVTRPNGCLETPH